MKINRRVYGAYVLICLAFVLAVIESLIVSNLSNASVGGFEGIKYGLVSKVSNANENKFVLSPFLPLSFAALIFIFKEGKVNISSSLISPIILLASFFYEIILFKKISLLGQVADIRLGLSKITYVSWDGHSISNHSVLSPNLFYLLGILFLFSAAFKRESMSRAKSYQG